MTILKTTAAALALMLTAGAASASCNIAAGQITGDGNFVDLKVTGCGYASLDMRGRYSFADIINKFGSLVTGIYGDGHYYEVRNRGDNKIATFINGRWHETRLDVKGDWNEVEVVQNGAPSSVDMKLRGDGNRMRVVTGN